MRILRLLLNICAVGSSSRYVAGYSTEMGHMLRRRLKLKSDPEKVKLIRKHHTGVTLRPQLEAEKDARRKMRLFLVWMRRKTYVLLSLFSCRYSLE